MTDTWHEVEIKATSKDGTTHTIHAEYAAAGATPQDATAEILKHAIQQRGASRVREIAADR